jgi:hypothetical protein
MKVGVGASPYHDNKEQFVHGKETSKNQLSMRCSKQQNIHFTFFSSVQL